MGQQQLLLIVLGVILVGIAVVLGIQYFGTGAEQGAKDELVAHSNIVASNAQEWFNKPKSMGGGGLTFSGFNTEFTTNLKKLMSSTNGDYATSGESATYIKITATPKLTNYKWKVYTDVFADSVHQTITPNP